jgi:hypothetical protein
MDSGVIAKKSTAYTRRSKWHRLRCWCLAWLIFCQFPVPIVHSHDSLAVLDPAVLRCHLQYHHADLCVLAPGDCKQCGGTDLHWHWLLPSELTWRSVDGEPAPLPVPNCLGVWGGVDSTHEQFSPTHDIAADVVGGSGGLQLPGQEFGSSWNELSAALPPLWLSVELLWQQLAGLATSEVDDAPCTSFAQSYRGVSVTDLVCVRLR